LDSQRAPRLADEGRRQKADEAQRLGRPEPIDRTDIDELSDSPDADGSQGANPEKLWFEQMGQISDH